MLSICLHKVTSFSAMSAPHHKKLSYYWERLGTWRSNVKQECRRGSLITVHEVPYEQNVVWTSHVHGREVSVDGPWTMMSRGHGSQQSPLNIAGAAQLNLVGYNLQAVRCSIRISWQYCTAASSSIHGIVAAVAVNNRVVLMHVSIMCVYRLGYSTIRKTLFCIVIKGCYKNSWQALSVVITTVYHYSA